MDGHLGDDPAALLMLPGIGVAAFLALDQLVLWLGKRDERVHLYALAWFAVCVGHLGLRFVQRGTEHADVAIACTRAILALALCAGLCAVALCADLAHAKVGPWAWRVLFAGTTTLAVTLWATPWIITDESYVRTELSGASYLAARPGPLLPLFSAWGTPLLLWCVHAVWRSRTLPRSDRAALAGGMVAALVLALNDTVLLAQRGRTLHLSDFAMLCVGIGLALLITLRHNRLRRDLGRAVDERTAELAEALARSRRALDDLGRSRASLLALVEALPDAALAHRDGRVVLANRAARDLLRTPSLDGMATATLVEEEAPAWLALPMVVGTALPPTHTRFRRSDASTVDVELTSLVVDDAGGPVALTLARDLTERRAMQQELMVKDRLASLGTLAAGVAHEINNPLGYMLGNLEALRRALEERSLLHGASAIPVAGVALDDVTLGLERVRTIVRDLRTFARQGPAGTEPVDLPAVIHAALRLTARELRERAEVRTELATVPPVPGDEAQLCQVLVNLLLNAAQACADAVRPGRIVVRLRAAPGNRVLVEVADNGAGIPAADLGRVFDPFFTTREVGRGTGLGLSVCHGIVTSLGGTLTASSRPGEGTTFAVGLPAFLPAPMPSPAAARSPAAPAWRVLVVDDDALYCAALRRLLLDQVVETTTSPEEALQRIPEADYDVILCDVRMPGMTGVELHAALERSDPVMALRIIFMTGGASTSVEMETLAAFADRCIEKPFTREAVLAMVNQRVAAAAAAAYA